MDNPPWLCFFFLKFIQTEFILLNVLGGTQRALPPQEPRHHLPVYCCMLSPWPRQKLGGIWVLVPLEGIQAPCPVVSHSNTANMLSLALELLTPGLGHFSGSSDTHQDPARCR